MAKIDLSGMSEPQVSALPDDILNALTLTWLADLFATVIEIDDEVTGDVAFSETLVRVEITIEGDSFELEARGQGFEYLPLRDVDMAVLALTSGRIDTLRFEGAFTGPSTAFVLEELDVDAAELHAVLDASRDFFGGDGTYPEGLTDLVFGLGWEVTGRMGDDDLRSEIPGTAFTGDDVFDLRGGNDTAEMGPGDDEARGGRGNDSIEGGAGGDTLFGGLGEDALGGGSGDDLLYGGRGADTLSGHAGDDRVFGGAGDDGIFGWSGDDRLHGGAGDDLIYGEGGDDELIGGAGRDELNGGEGDDTLYGGSGRATLSGGDGNDRLYAGRGDDTAFGEDGRDVLFGGAGRDALDGGVGNDWVIGGSGGDQVRGDVGRDTLFGGAGDDVIEGGHGMDRLTGGAGADQFDFRNGHGDDVITDFEVGTDRMTFVGFTRSGQERGIDVAVGTSEDGDTLLYYEGGTVLLEGVARAAFDAADVSVFYGASVIEEPVAEPVL